jgi:hypothetical protein
MIRRCWAWCLDQAKKLKNRYDSWGVRESPIDTDSVGGFEDFETGFEAFGAISSHQ